MAAAVMSRFRISPWDTISVRSWYPIPPIVVTNSEAILAWRTCSVVYACLLAHAVAIGYTGPDCSLRAAKLPQ